MVSPSELSLDQRVELIKSDTVAINDLITEYQPFIKTCTSQFTGNYTYEQDEYGIAMMAFAEAIENYNSAKGSFLAFARHLIKNRLIDYYRKERKHRDVLSLDYQDDTEEAYYDLTTKQSQIKYDEEMMSSLYRMEIENLKKELIPYHVTFADLVKISPSHQSTREAYKRVIHSILDSPDLLNDLYIKKRLPIQELEKRSKIPQKIISRGRKYIIALTVVMSGNYQYMQEYLASWGKET